LARGDDDQPQGLQERRLLVIQPLGLERELLDEAFIALDNTQAGVGDTVLVNREGNGARQVLKNPDACVISVIVGIVDSTYIEYGPAKLSPSNAPSP